MAKLPLDGTLVLASASVIRDRMLRDLDLPFLVIRPKFDEEAAKAEIAHLPPAEKARYLAAAKARGVNDIHPGWLVLGCDQVCEIEGEILSKPGQQEAAFRQLQRLRGKTHQQHSAAALYHNGELIWDHVATANLTMRDLTDEEILSYLQLDEPYAACGSYRFEAHGKHLFRTIEGTDDVIQGLPVLALLNALYDKKFLRLQLGLEKRLSPRGRGLHSVILNAAKDLGPDTVLHMAA